MPVRGANHVPCAVLRADSVALAFSALAHHSRSPTEPVRTLVLGPSAAAWIVSIYHGVLWNKLHTDSHDLQETLSWPDGIKYVWSIQTGHRYARWLLTNHVGHHAVNGAGNYNIVFPGPDHLAGTFYRLKAEER